VENCTKLLHDTIAAVKQAAAFTRDEHFEIREKDTAVNLVTSADVAVQTFLQENLTMLLPGSAFFGEEGTAEAAKQEYLWIVDPIDGTMNFSRGIGESAISVGLMEHGRPILGVVYNPFKEELFCAEAGKGAWLNGKKIGTSDMTFDRSLFCTAWSLYDKRLAPRCMAIMEDVYGQCNDFRRFGTCALELCYLAVGRCDLFFEIRVFPWDHAAAELILREAGGVITGLDGERLPYDRTTPVIAANNGDNHRKLLETVRKYIREVPYREVLI